VETKWVVVLLSVALVCATLLCVVGVMGVSELLPLLGGVVVVAHRMLETGRVSVKSEPRKSEPPRIEPPKSEPPVDPSTKGKGKGASGVGVVVGMFAGGGLASVGSALGSVAW
jgi:hypothetical protein